MAFERRTFSSTVLSSAVLLLLSACATESVPVIERLDEKTAVTVTSSRMPIIMSAGAPFVREAPRDYLQIGVIEINRMGSLQYFLWLGISVIELMGSADADSVAFESIDLVIDGKTVRLDVHGWSPQAIGTSEPAYEKLFPNSLDAYYQVSLDDLQLLAAAQEFELHTTGPAPGKFVPWFKQSMAREDLSEFLRVVMR